MKRPIAAVVVLAALLLAGTGYFVLQTREQTPQEPKGNQPAQSSRVEVGQPAPEVSFTDFSGNNSRLSDYRGKAAVLDFWAAWCPFCLEEMQELQKVQDKYGNGLVILGIHRTATESKQTGERFAQDRGVSYTLVVDPQDTLYRTFSTGISAMPLAVFIDQEGVIREIKFGPKTTEEIQEKVADLLK